jgi:hypothetical protein
MRLPTCTLARENITVVVVIINMQPVSWDMHAAIFRGNERHSLDFSALSAAQPLRVNIPLLMNISAGTWSDEHITLCSESSTSIERPWW